MATVCVGADQLERLSIERAMHEGAQLAVQMVAIGIHHPNWQSRPLRLRSSSSALADPANRIASTAFSRRS